MSDFNVNNKSYKIIKLLGHGKSGYSYLVSDLDNNLFCLKKIHHEPCDYYKFDNKFLSEINDYYKINKLLLMPKLIDYDENQELIIKEFINGDNILDLINNNINIDNYIEQISNISIMLKNHNLNIDYYPNNFIVNENGMYYIDYECNEYMDEYNFDNWGIKYWNK